MPKYPTEETKVKIKLASGGTLTGIVNTVGYDRLSDFIEKTDNTFIKVYRASVTGNVSTTTILLNKSNILYIIPLDPA